MNIVNVQKILIKVSFAFSEPCDASCNDRTCSLIRISAKGSVVSKISK